MPTGQANAADEAKIYSLDNLKNYDIKYKIKLLLETGLPQRLKAMASQKEEYPHVKFLAANITAEWKIVIKDYLTKKDLKFKTNKTKTVDSSHSGQKSKLKSISFKKSRLERP